MGFSTQIINMCGFLAKNINMELTVIVFRLKNIDLGAKFGKISDISISNVCI